MWTLDDTQFLIDNYPTLGANKCSDILGKTKGSVRNKASRLDLKSNLKRSCDYESWALFSDFELLEKFTVTSELLLHKHKICGYEWKVRPNNIRKGQGCPGCGKVSKLTQEVYETRLLKTDFKVLEPIKGVETKILHEHIKCNYRWNVRPHDIMRGQGCPKCSKNNYSQIALNWIKSFNNNNILHAENSGEQVIAGYKVDGYDPTTNIVYEFHGDVYHGNLEVFDEDDTCHPFDRTITAGELFEKTALRMKNISKVASIIYIWEKDYKNGKAFSRF
jgi:hypothetical protein